MELFYTELGSGAPSQQVRQLLLFACRQLYGFSALPEIAKTSSGKPYFPGHPEIFFSLSHGKRHILCALDTAPLGVDVEASDRAVRPGLPERICQEAELAQFSFLELWVLKESWIKLFDRPDLPLDQIVFCREQNRILGPDPSVSVRLLSPGAGCLVGVCSQSDTAPSLHPVKNVL